MVFVVNANAGQLLIVLGFLISLGVSYAAFAEIDLPKVAESQIESQQILLVASPQSVYNGQRVYVDLVDSGQKVRLRATIPGSERLRYGDVLLVSGQIVPPREEADFNELGFLRAHRSAGRLLVKEVIEIQGRQGNFILRQLHDLRSYLIGRINKTVSAPGNSIVAGVLLGDQGGLSEEIADYFRRTGTTHILVVSGSNVVIIAFIIQSLAKLVDRRLSYWLTSLMLLGFVVVSGADASIIRATIFYGFIMLAEITGRRIHALTLVLAVALIMSLINPWVLLYDVSFQLSFAAVLGIMLFTDWFSGRISLPVVKEFLAPTLAAQLGTLPILIFHFGEVSLVSPLANLLVVPIVPLIMATGAISMIAPWMVVPVLITNGLTSITLWLVKVLAKLPWASISFGSHQIIATSLAVALVITMALIQKNFPVEEGEGSRQT